MATSLDEVLGKLQADVQLAREFHEAYGRPPDRASLLDAIVTYDRSLMTPGSCFDRWLSGDATALTTEEKTGYGLFKSLGCASCHQGVNIGGNLFERHDIFRQLGSPQPEVLRVPSLRNVAVSIPVPIKRSVHSIAESPARNLSDWSYPNCHGPSDLWSVPRGIGDLQHRTLIPSIRDAGTGRTGVLRNRHLDRPTSPGDCLCH